MKQNNQPHGLTYVKQLYLCKNKGINITKALCAEMAVCLIDTFYHWETTINLRDYSLNVYSSQEENLSTLVGIEELAEFIYEMYMSLENTSLLEIEQAISYCFENGIDVFELNKYGFVTYIGKCSR